jgi:hypothetical protein
MRTFHPYDPNSGNDGGDRKTRSGTKNRKPKKNPLDHRHIRNLTLKKNFAKKFHEKRIAENAKLSKYEI